MAEENQEPNGGTEPQGEPKEPQGTDWKAEARKWEKRAKENLDKAKAWDDAQEANKTELEKVAGKLDKANAELKALKSEKEHAALVQKVLADSKLDAKYAPLLTASDEAGLKQQAELLGAIPKAPKVPSDKGDNSKRPNGETKEAALGNAIRDALNY